MPGLVTFDRSSADTLSDPSAGGDGAVRSWWLDGTRGPLQQPEAHGAEVFVLAVVAHEGAPLIITGGADS